MPVLVSFGVHARSIKGNQTYVKDEMFEVDAEIGTLRVLITFSNNLTLFFACRHELISFITQGTKP